MRSSKNYYTSKIIISAAALILAACQETTPVTDKTQNKAEALSLQKMMAENAKTEESRKVSEGMQAILAGDYAQANRIFNVLLIDDPLNSGLHTLNGLAYHLMGKKGDVAKYELAQAGYEQSLKIDPNNTFASLQLGRIKAEKKDYVAAQENFSNVLLHDPSHTEALYELASASYHLGDLKTAAMSIDRVLAKKTNDAHHLRAAALIYAAVGNQEKAQLYLTQYQKIETNSRQKKYLENRLQDWAHFHSNKALTVAQADPGAPAPVTPEAPPSAPQTPASPTPPMAAAGQEVEEFPPSVVEEPKEEMVVIDAVVMSVSDEATTSKGNNILENLTLSLAPWTYYRARNAGAAISSGSVFPTNNSSTASNTSLGASSGITGSALKGQTATLITQGISLGTVNYSLNIANASKNYVEIIGRPSLTASVGKKASFLTGTDKKIVVSGNFGGNVTQNPLGVNLEVEVVSYDQDTVTLHITLEGSAEGSLITAVNANQSTFDVTRSKVDTYVKTKLGETVMLAGHTESLVTSNKSGTPFLQNIPLLQYLFSEENTNHSRRSVMYLLTPRGYKENLKKTKQFFSHGEEFGPRPLLTEFEARHKDWYDPSYNQISILSNLGPNYHQFRTGDLKPLKWDHDDSVSESVRGIADFLWY